MKLTGFTLIHHPIGSVTSYTLRSVLRGNRHLIVLPLRRQASPEPAHWQCRLIASENPEFEPGEEDLVIAESELIRSASVRFT